MTAGWEGSRIDALIVTALKLELDAVLALGGDEAGWILERDPSGFRYHHRELARADGGVLRIAAAWSGQMGEGAAAVRATQLVTHLDPTCLAMCGICAGRRGDVFLGDVIVANRVYSYDHGKLVAAVDKRGRRSEQIFHDIETYDLEKAWAMDAAYFADDLGWSAELLGARPRSKADQERWILHTLLEHQSSGGVPPAEHPDRKQRCPSWSNLLPALRSRGLIDKKPGVLRLTRKGQTLVQDERLRHPDGLPADPPFRVHIGAIATGKTVREDPGLFPRLRKHVRTTIGVEMEAAAIGYVAEHLDRRAIVVKAVCDYADHEKDDSFQAFAARAAAEFLIAFLSRHLPSRAPTPEEPRSPLGDDFLSRVERVCALHAGPGATIERFRAPAPFGAFLRVCRRESGIARVYPVAAVDGPITGDVLDRFVRDIDAKYRADDSGMISTLVCRGGAAPESLVQQAAARRVRLQSFVEYQGLIDFGRYLAWQTARLENDTVYPPRLYIDQRLTLLDAEGSEPSCAFDTALEWLGSPHGRFIVLLGDFGTGKTFLLHELARRMGAAGGPLIPVLLEMRSLEKARSLDELVAQHLARAKMDSIRLDAFNFMLAEGRIALLFDGFDELALRVSYDRSLEHFDTLVQAAQGNAKVVVTSRTQHFISDRQVKMAIAERAVKIEGHRLAKLLPFTHDQIRRFLVNRLGSEDAAARRLALLDDVKDLLGLSANPRMLSFITEIEVAELEAARGRAGQITSASLYKLLIERWLKSELTRANPKGMAPGLTFDQLRKGATALAMLLWQRTEGTVSIRDLPPSVVADVEALEPRKMDPRHVEHQIGSGTLLVRDEDGNLGFIHQSVLEWLVAREAAEAVKRRGDSPDLNVREMSDLMVDFFGALAGPEVAVAWAEAALRQGTGEIAKTNALSVTRRLKGEIFVAEMVVSNLEVVSLAGYDLRGKDLSGQNLRMANLTGADLTDARLVGADLRGASLTRATLIGADLTRACLEGADLTEADFTSARLLGSTIEGARMDGAIFRAAKLVGAKLDSGALALVDARGAALPHPAVIEAKAHGHLRCNWVAWSRDSTSLASHVGGMVRQWDIVAGRSIGVMEGELPQVLLEHAGSWEIPPSAANVAFARRSSPDGSMIAIASQEKSIDLFSTRGRYLATLLHLSDGWVAFTSNGNYKLGGDIGGAFWHEIGECRFEPGELDPFLRSPLRVPDDVPLFELPPSPDQE
jgi:nucleoside phosphorylase